jgi:transposase
MDVAKAQVDIALRPAGERWSVPHETHGVTTRVERMQPLQPTRSVLAATGGLERLVTRAFATAALPVVVGHPRQAREVARATGPLATTEAVEARALAPVADVMRPPPRPLPDAQTPERRGLRGRRQPRMVRRTAAQHRLAGARGRRPQDIEAPMAGRKARLATLADDLETLRRASPRWRDNDDLWQRVPGLGPGCARPCLLERPAWGTRTRPHLAAVVGVAPLHGDRGTLRGRRTMWGGRAPVRTVLSMGTRVATRLQPQITALSHRLLAAGTIKKVALTACRHTLVTIRNAMLKHRTSWKAQEVQN